MPRQAKKLSSALKSQAHKWWKLGLEDGAHCFNKRRERFYDEYASKAEVILNPGPLVGPFSCVYRIAFRYGYNAARDKRERDNNFAPRARKQ